RNRQRRGPPSRSGMAALAVPLGAGGRFRATAPARSMSPCPAPRPGERAGVALHDHGNPRTASDVSGATGLVGREDAALVREGTVKLNRLAGSARTAAVTGAYGTVWGLLSAALPALPALGPTPCGLGEILDVAADCVERCGPDTASRAADSGAVPRLMEQAGRGGSSRLVVQASWLPAALGQGSGHRTPETAKTSP
ncbi:hypothetical protein AB0K02_26550, partial [Streptomyces sp. NPDC049597]